MSTRVIFATTALCLSLPNISFAQTAPSLWDLLKPEYLVQRGLQAGIMALRTQIDLKYGAMGVNLGIGQASVSDIVAWPLLDHDTEGACEITADRLEVRAAPLDRPDLIRIKVQAMGVAATVDCLPPEPQEMFALTGLDAIHLPRLTFDLEYDIAGASADVHVYARIDGFAAIDLTGDLDYLSLDGREDVENPKPVVYLRSAALTLENLGGWEALQGQIPPPFTDPASAAQIVGGMVGGAIAGANRRAADPEAEGDTSALSASQQAFLDSLTAAIPSFLNQPRKIVIETGFSPLDTVFLDFDAYPDDPHLVFADLQPVVSLSSARARAALPASLLAQALGDGAGDLDDSARAAVGTALVTGVGAPRSIDRGLALLEPLAMAGDGAVALTLARALDSRDPEASYRYALIAGAASQTGAAVQLDRLESRLPFARILGLQKDVVGDVQHPIEALQRVALMREEAAMRLSGIGRIRSYPVAALWAILASAAGDGESADILDQIDERVRMADTEGKALWAEAEQEAAALAMEAWIGQDLPARFGAKP
ncbi:hypothetical protein [Oceaniglobus indicus]|uniref:hypothetical protein n=1 Tax=Oceaniglobus indicus TaxID=2047749 RepID=UPI000C1A812D|nr:hypothetical protein [Oceaniglobus indicus]